MNDVFEPYDEGSARADAKRLRSAKLDSDTVDEIRQRLNATEGARRPDLDPDYPDMSEASRLLDEAVRTGDRTLLEHAAEALGDGTVAMPGRTSNRGSDRDADQIWKHD